ncbi:tRNA (adenosine(37)-N6)-dimethylallyltransferase MiaA [Virgibacillus halodenitrificans]|uniref:tRNA dimethylallyltransferase n=1 Tax=Virgibacillus halodenitrificans TaxID=1482 RepID=A0AAC9NLA1_VIRHA|nr:tRNA (adenosine(37)-N6)-dimethylallyltransferase MiaA [Virgibacillus halodenitrificans]APC48549.1 tRNA (adenosine(37)-N6)-dimethylallyltransferase MiaA [Virgibacillus halodenitrificans]MEC2160927.1 tRNA (adenosine(37)-N6)-dimethylallyltransferase MiaA [Virgibacillus halodenitrificans]MYL45380.1 tRNA (adenosine(37)-N6)-dimethylallyltransferase MiaA [Virgibacillus halodenitrificans]CDQ35763.1 tRNA dimethylallyltransferase [Virgibacillus halodenitrificans]
MKKTVIAIVGPTAVGKTKLSIEIAKRFEGEIISGDSMQVYKGMDIGTAKVDEREMQEIPHHLIDIKEPNEPYSAADFKNHVQTCIESIDAKGKIPIIVGGSGLYIQSALFDYNFSPAGRDERITKRLENERVELGVKHLYDRLRVIDPEQAEKIHPNNYRRVIRALEIYEITGVKMSQLQKEQTIESPYNVIFIGLEMERDLLYKRINQRVDKMIKDGLVEEVKSLYEKGYEKYGSMKAIGYKEIVPYIHGKQPFEEAVENLKKNSRRYAKRQYTWFRNKMKISWYSINPDTYQEDFIKILDDLAGLLQDK